MRVSFPIGRIDQKTCLTFAKPNNFSYLTSPYPNDSFEKNQNQISFKGVSTQNFEIKSLKNLRCPVCGLIMLDEEQINTFINEVSSKRGQRLVQALEKYEDDSVFTGVKLRKPKSIYRPQKQDVVNIIKKLAIEYPDKNLAELVKLEASNHIDNLIQTQLDIITELEKYLKKVEIPFNERTRIGCVVTEYKRLIKGENKFNDADDGVGFQRKKFIYALSDLTQNQEVQHEIIRIAKQMPTSDTEVDAFFVKYSKENRNSRDIANKLVHESLASAEHLTPKSDQGQNSLKNYICDCAECNSKRMSTPFYDWQKTVPNFEQNLQEYLNEVQKAIERKALSDSYGNYIDNIISTISRLSYGEIVLKAPESSNNRIKRNFTKKQAEIAKKLKDLKRMSMKKRGIRDEINATLQNPNYGKVQQYVDTMIELNNLKAQQQGLKDENASPFEIAAVDFAIERCESNFKFLSDALGLPDNINAKLSEYIDIITKVDSHKNAISINERSIAKEEMLVANKNSFQKSISSLQARNNLLVQSYGVDPDNLDDWLEYQHLNMLLELADKMLNTPAASKRKSQTKSKNQEKEAVRLARQLAKKSEKEIIRIAKQSIQESIAQMEQKETIEFAKQSEQIELAQKEIKVIDDELENIQKSKSVIKDLNAQIDELCGKSSYDEIKKEYERLLNLKDLIGEVIALPKKQEAMQKLEETISYRKGILQQLDKNYLTISNEEYDELMALVDFEPSDTLDSDTENMN